MNSSNPILKESAFAQETVLQDMPMTLNGTLNKLFLLSSIFVFAAALIWYKFSLGQVDFVAYSSIVFAIIGFVLAIVSSFKPKLSQYLAPIYAFSQGVVLSSISCFFEQMYPGIVIKAVAITFLTLFVMFFLYRFNILRVTGMFLNVLLMGTITIGVFYLVSFIATVFFKVNIPYFQNSSDPFSIGLNIVIALFAAFNLILDFEIIESRVNSMVPKYYEWYCAFGLLVTIFWLYIEILRLLARSASRK